LNQFSSFDRHPERSHPQGGAVEGPFLARWLSEERSLHYASLREAPVGMTAFVQGTLVRAARGFVLRKWP
jgi:hypothetical protein